MKRRGLLFVLLLVVLLLPGCGGKVSENLERASDVIVTDKNSHDRAVYNHISIQGGKISEKDGEQYASVTVTLPDFSSLRFEDFADMDSEEEIRNSDAFLKMLEQTSTTSTAQVKVNMDGNQITYDPEDLQVQIDGLIDEAVMKLLVEYAQTMETIEIPVPEVK